MAMLSIQDLGLIDYQNAWDIQRKCVNDVISGRMHHVLLLCEHPPVLTLGRLADPRHILFNEDVLKSRGINVISVDRGGEVTLHAPGQLILYPILNLDGLGRDLHRYLYQLEQVGIDFLKLFGIVGKRVSGKTGVWIADKKIMSIGIGVRKWVSFHGLGINIHTDLSLFRLIRPCGLDVDMTSLDRQTQDIPDMARVKNMITDVLKKEFGLC